MDCRTLRSDIEHLRSLRDALEASLAQATETGHGKSSVLSAQTEASSAVDQVLEKYLPDFFENNPSLSEWHFGDKRVKTPWQEDAIKAYITNNIFADVYCVNTMARLSDKNLLTGGIGLLYRCSVDGSGDLHFDEKIEGFLDTYDTEATVTSMASLPDGGMLIGGSDGALYEYREYDGKYELGPRLDWPSKDVLSISLLPDGGAIVIGDDNTLREYRKDNEGTWHFSYIDFHDVPSGLDLRESIVLPNGKILIRCGDTAIRECYRNQSGCLEVGAAICRLSGNLDYICSTAALPDNTIVIGDNNGTIYQIAEDDSGRWQSRPIKKNIYYAAGYFLSQIYSIEAISEDEFLIGGNDGTFCECTKKDSGRWHLGPRINGFTGIDRSEEDVACIFRVSDNEVIVGGAEGALHIASKPPANIDTLKQHLSEIIAAADEL